MSGQGQIRIIRYFSTLSPSPFSSSGFVLLNCGNPMYFCKTTCDVFSNNLQVFISACERDHRNILTYIKEISLIFSLAALHGKINHLFRFVTRSHVESTRHERSEISCFLQPGFRAITSNPGTTKKFFFKFIRCFT